VAGGSGGGVAGFPKIFSSIFFVRELKSQALSANKNMNNRRESRLIKTFLLVLQRPYFLATAQTDFNLIPLLS
jgi:hypothetical protein